jgi:hypothetical protein
MKRNSDYMQKSNHHMCHYFIGLHLCHVYAYIIIYKCKFLFGATSCSPYNSFSKVTRDNVSTVVFWRHKHYGNKNVTLEIINK